MDKIEILNFFLTGGGEEEGLACRISQYYGNLQ